MELITSKIAYGTFKIASNHMWQNVTYDIYKEVHDGVGATSSAPLSRQPLILSR